MRTHLWKSRGVVGVTLAGGLLLASLQTGAAKSDPTLQERVNALENRVVTLESALTTQSQELVTLKAKLALLPIDTNGNLSISGNLAVGGGLTV